MKSFREYITEDEATQDAAKMSVVNTLLSNFQRFANSAKEGDIAALTILSAAVSLLNTSDSPQAIQAAKRLAQMAAQRAGSKR